MQLCFSAPGESLHIVEVVDGELLGSIAASECLEPGDGNAGGACHKLEQTKPLFIVEGFHRLPEPQHHLVEGVVTCSGWVKGQISRQYEFV